ncbi:MAG: PCI domain-containing protein [Promethearchaeota archaeon]
MRRTIIGTCKYCGSPDIHYSCPICGEQSCFQHTGSTDVYYCKKHSNIRFNRAEAGARNNRCQVLEHSHCPVCNSLLEIVTLPNNQMYIKCTNSGCSWDSRTNSPIIIGESEREIEREAYRSFGVRLNKCNEKLKQIKGKEFCIGCFIKEVQSQTETPFKVLEMRYALNPKEIDQLLKNLVMNQQLDGILDSKNHLFIYITNSVKDQLITELQAKGFLDLHEIQDKLKASSPTTTRIMVDIIRSNKLRGTFTFDRSRYYLEQGLTGLILEEIKAHGSISHFDLSRKFNIPEGNIKNYIMNMMKNKILKAYFIDAGKGTISEEELEDQIENFCIKNGIFMITTLANHLKITPELARRNLFLLIQNGSVRGIFTQNHEFITEETLSEKIKAIARAYRTISIQDLARKLAITEQRVEEGLATLISRGSINGYIDMEKHQFVAEGKQPVTSFTSHTKTNVNSSKNQAQSSSQSQSQSPSQQNFSQIHGKVEVVRQYDFVGGQLHFKVVTRNMTNMAIHDIKVILDVPSSYRRARDLISVPVIDPGNTHGVDFYLEPAECGISTIGGTVLYKDALGHNNTIFIKPKNVQIKCPLLIKSLDTIEDCQKAIQSLPSDARAFLIADLPPQMAYSAAHRAVAQFDVSNVASYENNKEGPYEGESWFSSEAKVTGGRVITRVYMNGNASTLEIRVWCNEAGQLTGILAKMIELLFVEINLMRQIKSEERTKTIDAMAITRNLMETQNMCMLRYKASSTRIKLEDTYNRLTRMNLNSEESSKKIYDWVKRLEKSPYENEDVMLTDEDADSLDQDLQMVQQNLHAQLGAA